MSKLLIVTLAMTFGTVSAALSQPADPRALVDLFRTIRPLLPQDRSPQSSGKLSDHPSVDCRRVALQARSPVGAILCSGREGAAADWDLNSAYWAYYGGLNPADQKAADKAEDEWRRGLIARCQLPQSVFGISLAQRNCVVGEVHRRAEFHKSKLTGDALKEAQLSPDRHGEIQQALAARGLLADTPDGEFGLNTRAAIKRFQEQVGEAASGFLSPNQLEKLLAFNSQEPIQVEREDASAAPRVKTDLLVAPDAASSARLKTTTSNPNFRYCTLRGWTSERLLPQCEQLMQSISTAKARAEECFSNSQWSCVVSATDDYLNLLKTGEGVEPQTYAKKGLALTKLGKLPEGVRELRLAATLAPDDETIQKLLAAAERDVQSAYRIKTDIRGFFTGMPVSAFRDKLRSLGVTQCNDSGERIYPCIDQDPTKLTFSAIGPTTALWFAQGEPLVLWFTSNLQENEIWKLRFQFGNQKPYKDVLNSIIDQFGLSTQPDQSGSSSGSSWKAWDLPNGNMLVFDGGPGNYDLIIQNRKLPEQDKKARAETIKKLPDPKF